MNKRIRSKQLAIDIDEELRTQLKINAAKRNITIRMYVTRILIKAIRDENNRQAEPDHMLATLEVAKGAAHG